MFVAIRRSTRINGNEVMPPAIVEVTAAVGRVLINNEIASDYERTSGGRASVADFIARERRVEPRRRYRVAQEFARLERIVPVGSLVELPEGVGDELASQGFVQREGAPASHPLAEQAARY